MSKIVTKINPRSAEFQANAGKGRSNTSAKVSRKRKMRILQTVNRLLKAAAIDSQA